jgi:hypothetical protein
LPLRSTIGYRKSAHVIADAEPGRLQSHHYLGPERDHPLDPRASDWVVRHRCEPIGAILNPMPPTEVFLGQRRSLIVGQPTALAYIRQSLGPLLVAPPPHRAQDPGTNAGIERLVDDQRIDPTQPLDQQAGQVTVAPVLAQQLAGVSDDHVIFGRPRQRQHRSEQRPTFSMVSRGLSRATEQTGQLDQRVGID